MISNLIFTLQGNIPSKKNSYGVSKSGRWYKADKVVDYQNDCYKQIRTQKIPKLTGLFSIKVEIYAKDKRGDLDNKLVTLGDILQNCGVIDNDRHIRSLNAWLLFDKKNPRVEIKINLIEEK